MTAALPAGVAAASAYGVGDFLQGLSSRRLPSLTVLVTGQAAGLLVVLVGAAVLPRDPLRPRDRVGCRRGRLPALRAVGLVASVAALLLLSGP